MSHKITFACHMTALPTCRQAHSRPDGEAKVRGRPAQGRGSKNGRTSSGRISRTSSADLERPYDWPLGVPTYCTRLLKECTSSTAGTRSVSELTRYAWS